MPGKPIVISDHARFEMQRRGVTEAEVTAVIRKPGQVLPAREGREIRQSKTSSGKMLLRVVVKEDAQTYHVVTAYKTSRITKYWRQR
jgi:hypothetical protein